MAVDWMKTQTGFKKRIRNNLIFYEYPLSLSMRVHWCERFNDSMAKWIIINEIQWNDMQLTFHSLFFSDIPRMVWIHCATLSWKPSRGVLWVISLKFNIDYNIPLAHWFWNLYHIVLHALLSLFKKEIFLLMIFELEKIKRQVKAKRRTHPSWNIIFFSLW